MQGRLAGQRLYASAAANMPLYEYNCNLFNMARLCLTMYNFQQPTTEIQANLNEPL